MREVNDGTRSPRHSGQLPSLHVKADGLWRNSMQARRNIIILVSGFLDVEIWA
jgi:hypothetical protein